VERALIGERPAELPVLTLLQLPVFYFHVLFPQFLVRVGRLLAHALPLAYVFGHRIVHPTTPVVR
jgi:hypothetical protein